MSKNRGQSLKRNISRGSKNRIKGYTPTGEVIEKQPRLITEFVSTISKLLILKRSKCGQNRSSFMRFKRPKPYYSVQGTI